MGVSVPVPAWNRNQGNIRAARAEVSEAVRQVDRVRIELSNRLASAFSAYAAAKERAQRLATAILPRADRTYQLSRKAYLGGEFEYLRVLEAQRTAAEAHLELVRSRGELWHAASEIAGLMLDDQQPQGHASLAPERQQ
jgi:cobalt-zinc-cadmium efflux system outer membrane protein